MSDVVISKEHPHPASLLDDTWEGRSWAVMAILVLILVTVITEFRSNGLDWVAYQQEYYGQAETGSFEQGYVILVRLTRIANHFNVLLQIVGMIFVACHVRIARRVRTPLAFIAFCGYYSYVWAFYLMGSPRRTVALSLVALSMSYLLQRTPKVRRAMIIVVLAPLFHLSSVVAIPFCLYQGLRNRRGGESKIIPRAIVKLAVAMVVMLLGMVVFLPAVMDYAVTKVIYYVDIAPLEQDYLKDVPSIWLGGAKRIILFVFLWICYRRIVKIFPRLKARLRLAMALIVAENMIYVLGSLVSPVIGFAANFYLLGYVYWFLCISPKVWARLPVVQRKALYIAGVGCFAFFVLSVIGVIVLFPESYPI